MYSGDFTIAVAVHPLHAVVPGKYVMHGVLRYQACDNAQCFPPKTLPVSFEVKVTRNRPAPATIPHRARMCTISCQGSRTKLLWS